MSWYVAFVPVANHGLYLWVTGAGNRDGHCFAFQPTPHGWVRVERGPSGLRVTCISNDAAMELINNVQAQGTLLLAEPLSPGTQWVPPLFATCVESVKSLLCMRRPLIITPRQLRCELLKAGARQM